MSCNATAPEGDDENTSDSSPRVSCEFFPAKTPAGHAKFVKALEAIEVHAPDFISITWGALGADHEPSLAMHRFLAARARQPVAAHLTCGGLTRRQVLTTIRALDGFRVKRYVALRGDPVARQVQEPLMREPEEPLLEHASDLVAILVEAGAEDIAVAAYPECHPESSSRESDLRWLRFKVDAGATRAISQFFFEPEVFLRFRDRARARGIAVPLVAGILPVTDINGVRRFAEHCGASVPAALVAACEGLATESDRFAFATEYAVELCRTLEKEGVADFHLYTLNRAEPSAAIFRELKGGGGEAGSRAGASADIIPPHV